MKNCVPIFAADYNEMLSCVETANEMNCDLIEWRLDALNGKVDMEKVISTCKKIKDISEKKLIITLRTHNQGGLRDMDQSTYVWMIRRIIDFVAPEFIDIEMINCGGDAQLKMLTTMAHKKDIKVIVSYHDILYTEKAKEIQRRLCHMKYIGADLPKVAYTPKNEEDVVALIEGSKAAAAEIGPIIGISMGKLGEITRREGDKFGSVINFIKPIGSKAENIKDIGQLEA